MSEQKRTAVVTGGAAGIGQEIVRHLAQQGLRVVSVDWNETQTAKRRMRFALRAGSASRSKATYP